MTLVVSWIGKDTHGVTSSYIISDSRFTWPDKNFFDYGKKVFASKKYPELFGYAGDVLFPSVVLTQIIEMIDSGVLLTEQMSCEEKNRIIGEKIRSSLKSYPKELGNQPVQIIHISRDSIFKGYPSFHHYFMSYDSNEKWNSTEQELPDKSGYILAIGSGAKEFKTNYIKYQNTKNSNTSRNVYHCFVDTLEHIHDSNCGGAPQLVGLMRKPDSCGNNYGIIYENERFLLGMKVPDESSFQGVAWRNMLFEICDGDSKKRVPGAAKQPRPRNVI